MTTPTTANQAKLNALFEKGLPVEISNVMGQAIKEVNDERNKEKVVKAKELILEALKLQEQMNTEERKFNEQKKKFDKSLGKLMNRINGMMQNKPLDQIEQEEKEAEKASEGGAAEEPAST